MEMHPVTAEINISKFSIAVYNWGVLAHFAPWGVRTF